MKRLQWLLSALLCLTAAIAKEDHSKTIKIALMTASLPWSFGPYQSQMHKLSLILATQPLDNSDTFEIYWISLNENIPPGTYHSYQDLKPHIGAMIPPPPSFPMEHITFLGFDDIGKMSARKLNAIKSQYQFDALITLMDITQIVPDEPYAMPAIAWIPLHSDLVRKTNVDYWALRNYHGIASLCPSSSKSIENMVGKEVELVGMGLDSTEKVLKSMFGKTKVEFIPHMFDREALVSSADVGLVLLKDHSVALADSKLTNSAIINRGQEKTLEAGNSYSLFGEERKNDFIILMQGGNYEAEDRKGWDTSIQAFARFYNSLEDTSHVHLLIHSMESYTSSQDRHGDMDPPATVMPKGLNLRLALHEWGLPKDVYTIDIARHAPEVVAAYKKRANVCLHASKVEGFGMNVIECQAVGTPVITTNYTAMGDYTIIGRAVPHQQMIRSPGNLYEMAMPHVAGIADAIQQLYTEHLALKRGDEAALARREEEINIFNAWVESTCSPKVVGDKFRSLIIQSYTEFESRTRAKQGIFVGSPPTSGAYEIASGYHTQIVDWDAPWTILAADGLQIINTEALNKICWMQLLNHGGDTPPFVLVLPTKYEDGAPVPTHNPDGSIHDDLTIIVRTFMIAGLQGTMTRRKSFVASAIQNAQMMGTIVGIPENLAIVERKDVGVKVGSFAGKSFGVHVEL